MRGGGSEADYAGDYTGITEHAWYSGRMAADQLPEEPVASPIDAYWIGDDARWYQPTWSETARLLGWRWVYCAPLLLVIAGCIIYPQLTLRLVIYTWKLLIFAIAIPMVAFTKAARNVVHDRQDPFCIHCGYSLLGLPDRHRCPECGQPYLHAVIEEYRRDPAFFLQRCQALRGVRADYEPFAAGPVRRKSRDGT